MFKRSQHMELTQRIATKPLTIVTKPLTIQLKLLKKYMQILVFIAHHIFMRLI